MKLIFSHPTGNANARAAATGFMKAGMLYEFHTSIASYKGNIFDRLGAIGPLSEIRRRSFDSSLRPITRTSPWLEAGRMISSKMKFSRLTKHEAGLFCIDAIYKNIDKQVALRLKKAAQSGTSAIYAYEDSAAEFFSYANQLGLKCLYDLPIGYWRAAQKYLDNERERWPEWVATLPGFEDSAAKLERKDEELRLADRIFVASSFTAKTLQDFPGTLSSIEVIPYGFPPVVQHRNYSSLSGGRPLKLLFVGGLSQRKGIADLFAAVENLGKHVSLTVVGRKATNHCAALDVALSKHNWIPSLPHESVLKLMQEHDVLVFPSLFEGFGLVITEAMSQGTPVITTDRTAGPELIENGKNGWLIEAGSTTALQEAIEGILNDLSSVEAFGLESMETARGRSWETYGQELAAAVNMSVG